MLRVVRRRGFLQSLPQRLAIKVSIGVLDGVSEFAALVVTRTTMLTPLYILYIFSVVATYYYCCCGQCYSVCFAARFYSYKDTYIHKHACT